MVADAYSQEADANNQARQFFVDDDHEILYLLISKQYSDIPPLESLIFRFAEDHFDDIKDGTFDVTPLSRSSESLSVDSIPSAFVNERGRLHLDATMDLLAVSKLQAVQLTLATMRAIVSLSSVETDSSSYSSNAHFQALLGTRTFLATVSEYHYKQRLARMSVITELLRLEQEQQNDVETDKQRKNQNHRFLDSIQTALLILDKKEIVDGNNRGLMRLLLSSSCQPEGTLLWTQLISAEKLECNVVNSREYSGGPTNKPEEWNQFLTYAINRKRLYVNHERAEALEALLILLYNKIQGGVTKDDLFALLTAFASQNFFRSTPTESIARYSNLSRSINRLPKLAGLILVESMSLWKIFHLDSPEWIKTHTLFDSLSKSNSMLDEVDILAKTIERSCVASEETEMPESLALLAFGLLLRASGEISNDTSMEMISNIGIDVAMKANNDFGAFTYLLHVMQSLVVPADESKHYERSFFSNFRRFAFSIQGENDLYVQNIPKRDSDSVTEISAASLAYASIGRELLTATIHAFRSIILPEKLRPDRENMKLLSMLVASIFRSSPTMCRSFWTEWEDHTTNGTYSPMCLLLKESHKLAGIGLNDQMTDQESIYYIMPYLQMAANLSYNADTVEMILSTIWPGLLRFAIYVLSSLSPMMPQSTTSYQSYSAIIVDSVSSLAQNGNSAKCRSLLRREFESDATAAGTGIRNLIKIAVSSQLNSRFMITKVFDIITGLIVDAPLGWICDVISNVKFLQDSSQFWNSLFTTNDVCCRATMSLIICLTNCMEKVVFSSSISEQDTVEVLRIIRLCIHASCSLLLTSNADPTRRSESDKYPLYYLTAAMTLESMSIALASLRRIVKLHQSIAVRDAGLEFQESIVQSLFSGKGIGEAVFSYAVAPVTLSLAYRFREVADNFKLMSVMSESDKQTMNHSFSIASQEVQFKASLFRTLSDKCSTFLPNMTINDIVFDDGKGLKDSFTENDPVYQAAFNAVRFLNLWAVARYEAKTGLKDDQLVSNPATFLSLPGNWPSELQMDFPLSSICSGDVSYLSLLLVYVRNPETEEVGPKPLMTMQVLDFFSNLLNPMGDTYQLPLTKDGVLSRTLYESTLFFDSVTVGLADLMTLAQSNNLLFHDKYRFGFGFRILRVLSTFFSANPSLASKSFKLQEDSVLKPCFAVVKEIPSIFQSIRTNLPTFDHSHDVSDCYNLRLCIGCLDLIRRIWRYGRDNDGLEFWPSFFDMNCTFMSDVASTVVRNVDLLESSRENNSLQNATCRCLLLTCFSSLCKFFF